MADSKKKKTEQPKSKPMNILKFADTMTHLYANGKPPKSDVYYDAVVAKAKQEDALKKRLENTSGYVDQFGNREGATDRMQALDRIKEVKKLKQRKKIIPIDDELIAKKPKPPIINYLELQDWLNEIDPQWWIEEKPEDKVLLRVPRKMAQGIETILNLHKRST